MTQRHWHEFLEKIDFCQLTNRWSLVPLRWLEDIPPDGLTPAEEALYRGLRDLPAHLEGEALEQELHRHVRAFRQELGAATITLDPELTPHGSKVSLRYFDPDNLGAGDCLITVGPWDRVGHAILQQAGLTDTEAESGESALRCDPGPLAFRDLLIFPDRGTASPRAFRALCEKTLRQARSLGARRLVLTHLYLPQTGLPDRFAAAEVVSAVRQMLREGATMTVDITPLTASLFADYAHWFNSLSELVRGERETRASREASLPYPPSSDGGLSPSGLTPPAFTHAVLDFASRSTSLAQEAGLGIASWLRQAATTVASHLETPPTPWAPGPPIHEEVLEPTYEEQQALNLLYLGQWQQAQVYLDQWRDDSILGVYLHALYQVVVRLSADPLELPQSAELNPRGQPLVAADGGDLTGEAPLEVGIGEEGQRFATDPVPSDALEEPKQEGQDQIAGSIKPDKKIEHPGKKTRSKKKGKGQSTIPKAEPADALSARDPSQIQAPRELRDEESKDRRTDLEQLQTAPSAAEVVSVEEPLPRPERQEDDSPSLRDKLLITAEELGVDHPLSRYFQLLAWRLDEHEKTTSADQLEEDHARLLRAAWAWDDQALLNFLRGALQDHESGRLKEKALGYVPVFPTGSREAPEVD